MKIKRIIEIEESDYELSCQRYGDARYNGHQPGYENTAIAQSTPYNPSGDCISREAFRKHYCKINCGERQCVDHADRCLFIDELMQFKTEPERPKGEWYYGEDECGQDGWFCSECNFFVPWYYQYYEKDIDFIREYKACPHCLAEMVTYTGKDRDTKGGAE